MANKSFKQDIESLNPAMRFIDVPASAEAEPAPGAKKINPPPDGYKINPLYIETKSRRLQLLVQPSLYERLKKRANAEGVSVNELVNSILDDVLFDIRI